MNPEQILAALADVYAACPSYRDSGRVVTRFLRPDGHPSRTTVMPFRTAFVRPDRFRFEFSNQYRDELDRDQSIVWADGPDIRTWWSVRPQVERPESLGGALAGATGVSGGSAHTVPALLLPEVVGGRRLTELAGVTALGDEPLGGAACYRLSGRRLPYPVNPAEEESLRQQVLRLTGRPLERSESHPVTVWIDRGTFLIRRIEEQRRFETFWTETVTEYDPAVGGGVPEVELGFGCPAEPAAAPDRGSK